MMPDDEVRRRVLARRLCSGCGLDYNLIAHRPRSRTAATSAAPLVARDDDTEALAARLRDYREKTEPVIGLFRRKEFVVELDAARSHRRRSRSICASVSACRPCPERHPS